MSAPAGGGGGGGGGGAIAAVVAVIIALFVLSTGQCSFTVGNNGQRNQYVVTQPAPRPTYAPSARSQGRLEDEINRALGRPVLEPGVGYSARVTASPYDAPKQNCQVLASALSADGMYTLVRRACPR